jgi:6-phosphogluconolactonase (cycloisomerase 2 family)
MKKWHHIVFSLIMFLPFTVAGVPVCHGAALFYLDSVQDGVGGVDGLDWVTSVAISPDGNHAYATGFWDNAVAVFSRDTASGKLTFLEIQQDGVAGVEGLSNASQVVVSQDGNNVYVAGPGSNAVAVFSRNISTGALSFVEMQGGSSGGGPIISGFEYVVSVTISPDGKTVYAVASEGDTLAVFSRNMTTGALSLLETHQDGVAGVDGLNEPRTVKVSPDDLHVYVTANQDDAISIFSRNTTTGSLTYLGIVQDEVGGVDGLDGPRPLAISPDGENVYSGGRYEDEVVVFSRNGSTGALSFVEIQKDGVNGVEGLDYPRCIVVDPYGEKVYVTGYDDSAISVFERDADTGSLTLVDMKQNGVEGVSGILNANGMSVSPNSNHVYVAGSGSSAIAIFAMGYLNSEYRSGMDTAAEEERQKWDVNDDNQIGLEEAIHALQVTSGLRP